MSDLESSPLPELLEGPDQLTTRHHKRRRRRSRSRWFRKLQRRIGHYNWRIVLLVIVSVVSVIAMSGVLLSVNARDQVKESWNSLDRVWYSLGNKPGTDLTLADFEHLERAVSDLNSSLGSARRQTLFLRPLTFSSANLDTMLQILDAAQYLTEAANNMLAGAKPAVFFLTSGEPEETVATQISSGQRVVELLGLGRGRFDTATTQLDHAQAIVDGLSMNRVSPSLVVTVDGLRQFLDQLRNIDKMLIDSPDLLTAALGLDDTQTYLVLAQNSDELRPSGGYISTYGWMTVRNGRIVNYDYYPSTSTSPHPPSLNLASDVPVPTWWYSVSSSIYAAWDGSWYADFPSTAAMSAWYYDNGDNPQSPVDGVIAIDLAGFEYILKGLGSVTVEDYGVQVTSADFRDKIYAIRAEHSADLEHKKFLAALYRQILLDWQSADQPTMLDIRGGLLQALQEKHIMIYFTDQNLNTALNVLGWSGQQKSGLQNDYLMAAEANLGNKANRSVNRQLTYDVEIQPDGTLKNHLAVAYDYSARVAEADPAVRPQHGTMNYNSLLQVFVPANSQLVDTNNLNVQPTVASTDTHTIFVSRIGVEYNQSERYQFIYDTPDLIEQIGPYRRYKLVLQKQPGMLGEFVNVQITLPKGAHAISTSPAPAASYNLENAILEFRIELVKDESIQVIFTQ
jgi:hypothetical protein